MKSLIRDYFSSLSFVPINRTNAGIRFTNGSWNGTLEYFQKNVRKIMKIILTYFQKDK
jgi:hypothetical protein